MDTTMLDADSDGEYEYEYSNTETESFYLNLDLTAHHGAVRPPRRRPGQKAALEDPHNDGDDNNDNSRGLHREDEASPPIESAETGSLPNERIQILDLHTTNPIISYYNQLFSCTWADQIGTELVFASPDTAPKTDENENTTPPLHSGPSYELLAANSVKILGRKAQLAPNTGPGPVQDPNTGTSATASTAETPAFGSEAPRRPNAPSHQAQFLNKLQQIKAAKGETDTVRTIMSTKRHVNIDRLQGWARTEAQLAEIERLNERAARGDTEAQAILELLIQELNQESNAPESEPESDSDLDSDLASQSDDLIA
ncbi:Transcription factor TFIIIC tau55-like protein [Penicillium bovifimosum]|uniref:Transcription factor TFIIIC tau55-like protein n=1 Tax=Penicillium bovifimosum TaxID=126998 RepID=A0A9W9H5S1_9EURO|nr:Transcription factor TFIIIC tau55-like protein [Penicillium bovifimosum]KAJ5138926.1 Transcription factor TFIIIC tau55-like protein [Penicillium bovifimosum]